MLRHFAKPSGGYESEFMRFIHGYLDAHPEVILDQAYVWSGRFGPKQSLPFCGVTAALNLQPSLEERGAKSRYVVPVGHSLDLPDRCRDTTHRQHVPTSPECVHEALTFLAT
jgi:hypothetical protein